jgi:hypothetical protein
MGWQNLERLRQLLVGNGGSVLRAILKECAQSCMSLQSVVLSSSLALYAPTVTRLVSRCLSARYSSSAPTPGRR